MIKSKRYKTHRPHAGGRRIAEPVDFIRDLLSKGAPASQRYLADTEKDVCEIGACRNLPTVRLYYRNEVADLCTKHFDEWKHRRSKTL